MSINDALRLAQESDLDLVEVAPTARPPVCKLMDYGKFKYESALKARESRKNQAQTVIKEIKIRPKIDPHDYGTKKGHVERFLKQGDKVKVTIMFRGREQSRPELGYKLLQRLAGDVEELGFVESQPKQDGRNMIMVIGPHRKKADTKPVKAPERASARAAAPTSGELTASFAAIQTRASLQGSATPGPEEQYSTEPSSTEPSMAPSSSAPSSSTGPSSTAPRSAAPSSTAPRPAAQSSAAQSSAAQSSAGQSSAAPRSAAPRPAAQQSTAASSSAAPRPAAPRPGPSGPRPAGAAAPRPAAPRPGPQTGTATPKPTAPRPTAPRPAAPKPTAPRPAAGATPRPTAPKPAAPKPSSGG